MSFLTLKNRIINFETLRHQIEDFRLLKINFTCHTHLKKFPNGNNTQKCAICDLPTNPFSVYTKKEIVICAGCFHRFIDSENYLESIELLKIRVTKSNQNVASLLALINNHKVIDAAILTTYFKGMTLLEIEYYFGLPQRFGSFDYGQEAGTWRLNEIEIEIWFNNEICLDVSLV